MWREGRGCLRPGGKRFGKKVWGQFLGGEADASLYSPSSEKQQSSSPWEGDGGGKGAQHPPSPTPGQHEGRMLVAGLERQTRLEQGRRRGDRCEAGKENQASGK